MIYCLGISLVLHLAYLRCQSSLLERIRSCLFLAGKNPITIFIGKCKMQFDKTNRLMQSDINASLYDKISHALYDHESNSFLGNIQNINYILTVIIAIISNALFSCHLAIYLIKIIKEKKSLQLSNYIVMPCEYGFYGASIYITK